MLTALLLGMMIAQAPPSAPDDGVIPHRRYRLANGLDVVLHDDDSYPLIAVRAVYHVGSMHDPAGKGGVAHVLEHAMFGGSDHVADGEFYRHLARAGANGINGITRSAATVYLESIPANQLALALWLESDRMGFFRVGLARSTVAKERAIVLQELAQRRRGSDEGIAISSMADFLFPAGHVGHMGNPESLARIEFADIAAMRRAHYGPNNATLVLSGALPEDVDALIERYFGRCLSVLKCEPAEGGRAAVAVGSHRGKRAYGSAQRVGVERGRRGLLAQCVSWEGECVVDAGPTPGRGRARAPTGASGPAA